MSHVHLMENCLNVLNQNVSEELDQTAMKKTKAKKTAKRKFSHSDPVAVGVVEAEDPDDHAHKAVRKKMQVRKNFRR